MSKPLRAPAALLAASLSAVVLLCAQGAAAAKATIADFVRAVLPDATNNFASLRGAKIEWDLPSWVYAGYKLRLPAELCSDCRINDNYGRGSNAEYWAVGNIYTQDPSDPNNLIEPFAAPTEAPPPSPAGSVPPGAQMPPPFLRTSPQPEWPIEKTEAYVKLQLTPLLAGFSVQTTTSVGVTGETVPTLVWSGPRHVWVRAKMYPKMAAGFLKVGISVGHDVKKSVHVLLPPTRTQLSRMRNAIRGIVRAAVPAASQDFSRLRGGASNEDAAGYDYRVNASFGPAFRPCAVFDIASRMGKSWSRKSEPAWAMICSTFPVLGSRANLEKVIRSAIRSALPRGFSPAMDANLRFYYDDLWRNDAGVSVAIDWGDPHDDVVTFSIRIMHFLSRR